MNMETGWEKVLIAVSCKNIFRFLYVNDSVQFSSKKALISSHPEFLLHFKTISSSAALFSKLGYTKSLFYSLLHIKINN